ncbi:MarR family winged helix-turn-helix transcriptional regulator [Salana multivorans]
MGESLATEVRAALQRQLVMAILSNERVARQHGLLVTDLQALHLLVLRDDVRTPRQIADVTGMPTSTVTKLINRLEAAGYLRRSADPRDRRRTLLEIVPENIASLTALYGRADHALDALGDRFTSEELSVVIRYLDAVSEFYSLGDGFSPAP